MTIEKPRKTETRQSVCIHFKAYSANTQRNAMLTGSNSTMTTLVWYIWHSRYYIKDKHYCHWLRTLEPAIFVYFFLFNCWLRATYDKKKEERNGRFVHSIILYAWRIFLVIPSREGKKCKECTILLCKGPIN